MKDLRSWLEDAERLGQLRRVDGADPELEIGILTDVNSRRKGPALLFDRIKGFQEGFRILTGALLDAERLGLTFGYSGVKTDQELVAWLEQNLVEYERRCPDFPPCEVSDGPVLEYRHYRDSLDLLTLPSPKWHEHDGGRYLGTGCVVVTKDPDTGAINLGTYRVMLHDRNTLALHISSAHHGAVALRKYHVLGRAAPVAISFGHHPLFLVAGGMSIPYGTSEYQLVGAVCGEPVSVVCGEVTGLPIPSTSELAVEGFCPPDRYRDEGPFGEYTGYYASGAAKEPIVEVQALYHRADPINLGAMPGRPPNDYSYMMSVMKSANVAASLRKDGIVDVQGVWYHEVAAGDFFVVVSIKQRYPGHARQAAYLAAQCRPGGTALGRYVVVVDEDIDPRDLNQVIWAMGTRTDPERDIDLIRNTYASPVDPMYPNAGKLVFGCRAIIDACKPYDWIDDFPRVAESSPEDRQRVLARWKHLFEDG